MVNTTKIFISEFQGMTPCHPFSSGVDYCPEKILAPEVLFRAIFTRCIRLVEGFTGYAYTTNMAGNQTLSLRFRGTNSLLSLLFKANSLQSRLAPSLGPSGEPVALRWCYPTCFISECLRSVLLCEAYAAGQQSNGFCMKCSCMCPMACTKHESMW